MNAQTSPIVTLAKLKLEHWTQGSLYDSRDTSFGALLGLKDLGIGRVRLLSNNPEKARQLAERGVEVEALVPLVVGVGEHNESYLDAKRDRMGHALPSHQELVADLTKGIGE